MGDDKIAGGAAGPLTSIIEPVRYCPVELQALLLRIVTPHLHVATPGWIEDQGPIVPDLLPDICICLGNWESGCGSRGCVRLFVA